MEKDLDAIGHVKSVMLDHALRFGPKLVVAVLILVVGVLVGRWVGRVVARGLRRFEFEPPVRLLMVRAVRVVVFALFLILALQNLGIELLPLIAGLSVAGAGVALATQGVLSNVVAGLTIIFTKPYRVSDYIEIVGVQGQVQAINLFSTTLLHADQSRVVVPNRKIVGEILHNYGRIRQSEVLVGVGYDVDLPRALELIRGVTAANPRVLREPAAVVAVAALGESAVQIAVRPWTSVEDFGNVAGELSVAIVDACRRAGVSMPFPQREVRLLGTAG
ncbi:MAG: mechanosensitive ion channel family protein [Proteobacteria bacterium]|nr:mechanosensitive ion channel family protein [Pseudomonadota bacterium]